MGFAGAGVMVGAGTRVAGARAIVTSASGVVVGVSPDSVVVEAPDVLTVAGVASCTVAEGRYDGSESEPQLMATRLAAVPSTINMGAIERVSMLSTSGAQKSVPLFGAAAGGPCRIYNALFIYEISRCTRTG